MTNDLHDLLTEAERNLSNMIFMAEAAEDHGVAYGSIARARLCLEEIRAELKQTEEALTWAP